MIPARLARFGANGINVSVIRPLMTAQTMIWLVMPWGRYAEGLTKVPASAKAG
jgi:hypothetical protein